MSETTEPTVADTVTETTGILDNLDVSALAEDETPQEVEAKDPPAEEEKGEAEPEATEEAEADEAAPAAEGEEKGEVDADPDAEPEPEKPAKPAAKAPESKVDPAADTDAQARAARLAEINRDIKAIRATPKDQYDPFEHGVKLTELLAEKDELRDAEHAELKEKVTRAEEDARYESGWKKYERENPDIGARGRSIWEEELTKAQAKYKDPSAAAAVAQERWEDRTKLIRRQKEAAREKTAPPAPPKGKVPVAPPGKPPVTKGGGSVIPKGAPARPQVKETDPEKLFVAAAAGGMKDFLS